MRLVVSDFEKYRDGFPLWSTIYLQTGERCYPCEGWVDATSAILEMWINDIIGLINGTEKSKYLHFMDGDYVMQLIKHSGTAIVVKFFDQKGEVIAGTVDLLFFALQLLSADSLSLRK